MTDGPEEAGRLDDKRGWWRRTYRSTDTAIAAAGSGLAAVGFAVIAASSGSTPVAAVFAVLMLAFGLRLSMVGIRADADSARVVTFFKTRSVAWAGIDHFEVLPMGRFPYAGQVVTRDGRQLGTPGLSTSQRKSGRNRPRIQHAIDELNAILRKQE